MILTHTISVPELVWTVWCGIGLLFFLKLLMDAMRDWKWVVDNNLNSIREYASVTDVLVFASMSITNMSFVIIGLIALMLPTATAGIVSPLTYVITGVFTFASTVKTIFAFFIIVRKRALIEKLESKEWIVYNQGEKAHEAHTTPS